MRRFLILLALFAVAPAAMAKDQAALLGYLGQSTAATRIYAAPNSRARVFSHVPSGHYLILRTSEVNRYDQVLMQNGIYGYVPAGAVKVLPYEVHAKSAPLASRSMRLEGGDNSSRASMADYAIKFVDKIPYKWGGTSADGIDCSGFVQKMYGAIGVQLPRTAAEQALVGEPIYRLEDLKKGDRLYFWESKRGMIGHTGIYIGNGYFVHSSHGRGGVETDYLTQSWRRILVAARR
jgi:cell wall-associated NlpC family hydrolase